jgi:nitrite reductase/ring-hydroxylating ferredoxin subunit
VQSLPWAVNWSRFGRKAAMKDAPIPSSAAGAAVPIEPTPLKNNEFRVSDVPPGSALLVGDVAVFNVAGSFCATQDKCTHRQGPLSEGELDGSTVTCPYHGAQFNVCTGAVLRGPAKEPLKTYRVIVGGDIGRIEGGLVEAQRTAGE